MVMVNTKYLTDAGADFQKNAKTKFIINFVTTQNIFYFLT